MRQISCVLVLASFAGTAMAQQPAVDSIGVSPAPECVQTGTDAPVRVPRGQAEMRSGPALADSLCLTRRAAIAQALAY
ncbi:MAG: hypothetical protein ABI637_08915, partial [Gemmatimonadota bacterium]